MLMQFPPMGVYETLFKFADATAKYMGDAGVPADDSDTGWSRLADVNRGGGGFYHWGRLPNGLSAESFDRDMEILAQCV